MVEKRRLRYLTIRDYGYLKELAHQGDEKAIRKLISAAGGIDSNVRCFVIRELGRLGTRKAVPTLMKMLLPNSKKGLSAKEEAAKALGEIALKSGLNGDAIDRLLSVCEEAKSTAIRTEAALAIGKCGKCKTFGKKRRKQAIEVLVKQLTCNYLDERKAAAQALQMIDWQPESLAERTRLLIAVQDWNRLSRARNQYVPFLLQVLIEEKEPKIVQENIVRALGECGSLRAASTIIEWLFQRGTLIQNEEELSSWVTYMKPLFADYTSLILRAASYVIKTKTEWEDKWGDNGEIKYYYDCAPTNAALDELCSQREVLTNNLLQCASQKADVEIVTGEGWNSWGGGENHGMLDFDSFRQKAKAELEKRGKRKVLPSLYLRRLHWSIRN